MVDNLVRGGLVYIGFDIDFGAFVPHFLSSDHHKGNLHHVGSISLVFDPFYSYCFMVMIILKKLHMKS